MDETTEILERVIYERPSKLPVVSPQGSFTWQVPVSLAVPEELKPGMTLVVKVTSEVGVVAQLLKRAPGGAMGALVLSPPLSSNLNFEYPVDVPGFYELKLSQGELYPVADATVRMAIRVSKPKDDGEEAASREDMPGERS